MGRLKNGAWVIFLTIFTNTLAEFADYSFLSKENACSDPNNEFMCRNKQCIPKKQRCDDITQCADATDEIGCGEFLQKP